MEERGVTLDEIEYVLRNYELSQPGRPSGTRYVGTVPSGRKLSVCVTLDSNLSAKVIVKSVFWDNEEK